tara:strand:- start:334 stop:498 length:165 start_codon:yes stop_codon:yes gene_type:complete
MVRVFWVEKREGGRLFFISISFSRKKKEEEEESLRNRIIRGQKIAQKTREKCTF